jgi:transcriptional regulator with XRE-family HTH domain
MNKKKTVTYLAGMLPDVTTLGDAVDQSIKLSNRSKKEVAECLGISASMLSQVISGKREFKIEWLKPFCQLIDNWFVLEFINRDAGFIPSIDAVVPPAAIEELMIRIEALEVANHSRREFEDKVKNGLEQFLTHIKPPDNN